MRRDPTKGFTLIELLVVIAIIGLLSSIVLASLSTARSKGADAAIQSDMNTVRVQAELAYASHAPPCYTGTPSGVCSGLPLGAWGTTGCGTGALCSDPVISRALTAAVNASANTTGGLVGQYQGPSGESYAMAVQMKTDPALAWCVDSTGVSKLEGTPGGTALTSGTIIGSTIFTGNFCR